MYEPGDFSKFMQRAFHEVGRVFGRAYEYYCHHSVAISGLGIIVLSAFLLRFVAVSENPAPPGADYGNYLTNLHAFLGNDVTGQGVQYPAVFLLYLWTIVSIFGELTALQVSGPLLGAALSLPSYLLLRNYVRTPFALVGTALIVFSEGVSEMIGWGGNPNLLGMTFGISFFAFLARFIAQGKRVDLAISATSFGLLAGSHQVSVAYFGFSSLLAMAILALTARERRAVRRGLLGVGTGVLASIPFIPFYIGFAQSSSNLLPAAPILFSIGDVAFLIGWLFRDSLGVWIPIAIIAVLGYWRMRTSDRVAFSLGVSLLISPLLLAVTIMVLHPVRPLYFLYLGLVPGAMTFAQAGWDKARSHTPVRERRFEPAAIATALILAFALVLMTTAYQRTVQAVDWYFVANKDVLDGLRWIKQNTPEDSVVATSGSNRYGSERFVGCSWGWWIEGYAQRKSFCTVNPQDLAWDAQVREAIEANKAFSGSISLDNGWLRIGDYAPYSSQGNPIVYGEFGHGYEAMVYFNDARVVVQWSSSEGGPLREDAAFFLTNKSTELNSTPTRVRLEHTAGDESISIHRTVDVPRASRISWVNYSLSVSGTISRVSISLFGTSTSRLANFDASSNTLTIGGVPGFRESLAGSVRIVEGGDALSSATFMTNPEAEYPEVGFVFSVADTAFSVSFAVWAQYDGEIVPSNVEVFRAESIFALAGVNFVFVDKLKVREMEWFTNNRSHFAIAYQNSGVALFAVAGGEPP